jgi:hypothetical protein
VPTAIVSASIFTYVVGWLFNIVLVFCMGDPKAILKSPAGQPVRSFLASLDRLLTETDTRI